jgi:hypothetical protein
MCGRVYLPARAGSTGGHLRLTHTCPAERSGAGGAGDRWELAPGAECPPSAAQLCSLAPPARAGGAGEHSAG